jgi:Fe-S cluster assembly ATP-binding protein
MPANLSIDALTAGLPEQTILHELTLKLEGEGSTVLLGPNGSGKSTLAQVLAGNPAYAVTGGTISWQNQDLLELTPEQRAAQGIFLAFQTPPSLPGVTPVELLQLALAEQAALRGEPAPSAAQTLRQTRAAAATLNLPKHLLTRGLGDGASGGEKKRLELLQLLVLQPKLAILDEIDSGLDLDGIRLLHSLRDQLPGCRILLITHSPQLGAALHPDQVLILQQGRITRAGGPELLAQVTEHGFPA